jgi:glycosyltransferase involved in cell wall biosynthesis
MVSLFQQSQEGVAGTAVVLIPAYNAAATIAEALDALQANPALDAIKAVIILDDASSDETVRVARSSWRSSVPLEVWSNKVNAGERAITNTALARLPANVEWAFLLHADDVVKLNWISLYLDQITDCSEDVASICSSYDNWYHDTGRVSPGEEYPDRPAVHVRGTRQAVMDTLNRGCWWHLSGCAIRVNAFRRIGDFEPSMPQLGDWEWLIRCLAKGFSVVYLPRSTMLYRQHSSSVSSISFRQARDIREKLRIFTTYRDQGYLSSAEYHQKICSIIYQLSRRALVRAVRCDFMALRCHAVLLGRTSRKYLMGKL